MTTAPVRTVRTRSDQRSSTPSLVSAQRVQRQRPELMRACVYVCVQGVYTCARGCAQLFNPVLPDDLYINFRAVVDRILFTAIALHPTTSGGAGSLRSLRERTAGTTSLVGRTVYAHLARRGRPSQDGRGADASGTRAGAIPLRPCRTVDGRTMEVLDMVEVECAIPSMSVALAALNAAYEHCYRMQDQLRVF